MCISFFSHLPTLCNSILSAVLMLRGLDYRTTEDQIHRRLKDLSSVAIKDVRLITDKYTNKSRGFCFVEVSSVAVSYNIVVQYN